jgi:hypothetical protein
MNKILEEAKKSPNVDLALLSDSLRMLKALRDSGYHGSTEYNVVSPRKAVISTEKAGNSTTKGSAEETDE